MLKLILYVVGAQKSKDLAMNCSINVNFLQEAYHGWRHALFYRSKSVETFRSVLGIGLKCIFAGMTKYCPLMGSLCGKKTNYQVERCESMSGARSNVKRSLDLIQGGAA